MISMVGAKLVRLFLSILIKRTNLFKPLRIIDVPNMTVAQRSVKRVLIAVFMVVAKIWLLLLV